MKPEHDSFYPRPMAYRDVRPKGGMGPLGMIAVITFIASTMLFAATSLWLGFEWSIRAFLSVWCMAFIFSVLGCGWWGERK